MPPVLGVHLGFTSDGHVLIAAGQAEVGSIVPVRITRAMDYDVVGDIVEEEVPQWVGSFSV